MMKINLLGNDKGGVQKVRKGAAAETTAETHADQVTVGQENSGECTLATILQRLADSGGEGLMLEGPSQAGKSGLLEHLEGLKDVRVVHIDADTTLEDLVGSYQPPPDSHKLEWIRDSSFPPIIVFDDLPLPSPEELERLNQALNGGGSVEPHPNFRIFGLPTTTVREKMEELSSAIKHSPVVCVSGPTGCGKLTAVRQLGAAEGQDIHPFFAHNAMDKGDLVGRWELPEPPATAPKFEPGSLAKCVEKGGWFVMGDAELMDSIPAAARPKIAGLFHDNPDKRGMWSHNEEGKRTFIKANPDFRLILVGQKMPQWALEAKASLHEKGLTPSGGILHGIAHVEY